MRSVNIHEAKTHLSRLVEEAANGGPFIIAKAGRPLVKVVPLEPEAPPSWLGSMRDADWRIPDDFDTMCQEEIVRLFEGEEGVSLLLLDTHLLIWGIHQPERLSEAAIAHITAAAAETAFSAASIWEVAIKTSRQKGDFSVDAAALRRGLVRKGLREVAITGAHAAAVASLPPLHKDPFDRILIAQARLEGAVLLTADAAMARYGEPVAFVG